MNIVKPTKVKTIPDILSFAEVEMLLGATRKLRYGVFLLTTYSMGLRLGETLSLQVEISIPRVCRFIFAGEKATKTGCFP